MQIIEHLKNPIITATIVTILILVGFYFYKKEDFKKDLKKTTTKYGIVSVVIGLFTWILMTSYSDYSSGPSIEEIPVSDSIKSSYRILDTKGSIKPPPPDIFIELLDF